MKRNFQLILRKLQAAGFAPLLFLIGSGVCSAAPPNARTPPTKLIRVWAIGSSFTSPVLEKTIPLELRQQADAGGYVLAVDYLSAAEFSERLRRATQIHEEPEILTFRNLGIFVGVNTAAGHYDGLLQTNYEMAASLEVVFESLAAFQAGGWSVVLVRTATNYDSARALALQSPRCAEVANVGSQPTKDRSRALETAMSAARQYLAGNEVALAALADDSKLGKRVFLPNVDIELGKLQPCNIWGNEKLVFVSLVSTLWTKTRGAAPRHAGSYSAWLMTSPLGQQSLLAVLRKRDGVWRVMAITDDPVNTGASGVATNATLNKLSSMLIDSSTDPTIPEPAQLLTPDRADLRRPPNTDYRTFLWQPSAGEDVVCEIAEFLVGDNQYARERTRLFFFFGREGRISAGMLWGRQGRWRVWSINRAGAISLTTAHSYRTH